MTSYDLEQVYKNNPLMKTLMQFRKAVLEVLPELDFPEYPTENVGTFPFAVIYAVNGSWVIQPPMSLTGLHNIVLEIHETDSLLQDSIKRVMEYNAIIPKIINELLGNQNIDKAFRTLSNVTYTVGELVWNDVNTYGIQFTINQVLTEDVTINVA